MQCDLCGSEEQLCLAEVEGTRLNICKSCSKYGNIIEKSPEVVEREIKRFSLPQEENVQLIVNNYNELIKKRRESLGLKQKELAKKIAEKESIIHKLESKNIEPTIDLARKLEKALGLKLVMQEKVEKIITKKSESSGVTIGDMFKL